MKKIYSKPGILFEDFQMSTNIAGDCDTITTLQGKDACGYETRNGVVFVSSLTGCAIPAANGEYGDGNNTICYHVPIDTKNLFNS